MALLRRITLIAMSAAALAATVVAPSSPSFAAAKAPAPRLVSPANNTEVPIKDLILKWRPVPGAVGYEVEMGRNRDFTNNVVALPGGGKTVATVFEVPVGLDHATYFWRVRADMNGSAGAWSAPREFLREWEAPITIVHAPSSTDPTISWAPLRGASEYHVIVDPSPVSSTDLLNNRSAGCMTHATSYNPGMLAAEVGVTGGSSFQCSIVDLKAGTKYYWGVAAFDGTDAAPVTLGDTAASGCGTELPECDASTVVGAPFIYEPPSGGTNQQLTGLKTTWHANSVENPCDATAPCPTTPTFSWTPVQGSDLYFVRIYLDRDATTIYREYATSTPTITPPDQFQDAQPGKPYFWAVEALTCGGPGVQCTPPNAASQACRTPSTSGAPAAAVARPAATTSPTPTASATPAPAPTITGISVRPAGPEGDQSMQGGTTATVTITGTDIASGACVVASGGVITSAPATGQNTVSFQYYAPVPGGDITFNVENPDGQLSGDSPALSVDSSSTALALSAISSFQKRSGPVTLRSPANHAVEHGSFTFKWNDYIASGSRGTYDPKNYKLQVSTDSSFDNTVINESAIDLTQYTPPTNVLTNGHYFWRVNAIDETGNELTWSAPREVTVNATSPTVEFSTPDGVKVSAPLVISFSDIVRNVNARTLKIVPEGKSRALKGKLRLGASPTEHVFHPRKPLATGGTYDIVVSPSLVDANGNSVVVSGTSLRTATLATNHSRGWNFGKGWSRHPASGALSHSYMEAKAGRTAAVQLAGDQLELLGCKGPGMGSISVRIGGSFKTISEHQSFTRCGVVLWHRALPTGIHTLRIAVAKGHGNVDAVRVT